MFLVLPNDFNSLVYILADEQDLGVRVVQIVRLHLRPREASKFLNNPATRKCL